MRALVTEKGPQFPFLATCPVILPPGRLYAVVGVVRHRTIGPTHIRLFESESTSTWPRVTLGRCKAGLGCIAAAAFHLGKT